jgi:hypothetical protein
MVFHPLRQNVLDRNVTDCDRKVARASALRRFGEETPSYSRKRVWPRLTMARPFFVLRVWIEAKKCSDFAVRVGC